MYDFRHVKDFIHSGQRLFQQGEHLVDVVVLFVGELRFAFVAASDTTCQVVTGVGNTFYFRNGTEHDADLFFTFRAQAAFSNECQVIGDLDFHAVADVLVFLDTAVYFQEVILVLFIKQVLDHAEHALRTFSEYGNFLFSLHQ